MHQIDSLYQNGSTLVVTVLILAIMSIIGTAALTLTNTELLIARNMRLNTKAFYLAEGAANEAVSSIKKHGTDQSWVLESTVSDSGLDSQGFWSNNATNSTLANAWYVAELSTAEGQIFCYGRGYVHDSEEILMIGLKKEISSGYALFSNGGLELKDNTITNGDVFSNGYMELKDGAVVHGNLESGDSIDENDAYSGEIKEYLPIKSLPDIDWGYMNSTADNYVIGSKAFDGTESGVYFVNGDVSFVVNAEFTNNISIISTGKIETSEGLDMQCVDGYPALASMSDIEINGGDSMISTEIRGLIHGTNKVEVKGESDIYIYGSIVTNAPENNALELKDENGILTVEYDDRYLRKNKFIQNFWKDI